MGTDQVVRALDSLCASLAPGDRIPTHTELMRRFGASERAVRAALDELQRTGRIVRKNGVGTFVADLLPASAAPAEAAERTIIAVTRPDRSFFDRCMDLLYRHAEAAGVSLVCQPTETAEVGRIAAAARRNQPSGCLLFGYGMAPLARELIQNGVRAVVIGAPAADVSADVPCIYGDHLHGAYLAAKHLIDLGHREIGFLHSGAVELARSRRWLGHQRAVQEARRRGLKITDTIVDEAWIVTWSGKPERATTCFRTPGAPTAIVAWNDHEAAKFLAVLTRAGIRVPHDVSLVGYDALPEGDLVYPRLTTVDHGIGQQLLAAVDLLTQPAEPRQTHTIVVMPSLIVRESTAAPPAR